MMHFMLPRTHASTYEHLTFLTENYSERIFTLLAKASPESKINGFYVPCEGEGKNKINAFPEKEKTFMYVSNSLANYLNNIKERIEEYSEEWDIYKKYTNPYEFIHTNIPNKKKNISKYKPLSRSYYKMVEIIQHFYLIPPFTENSYYPPPSFRVEKNVNRPFENSSAYQTNPFFGEEYNFSTLRYENILFTSGDASTKNVNLSSRATEKPSNISTFPFLTEASPELNGIFLERSGEKMPSRHFTYLVSSMGSPINTFHLAEGPGGFIEATLKMRNNPYDKYIGMTLMDNNDLNIPSWKKSGQFMRENKNVFIETGADGTGNILSLQNFVYCKEKYESSMDFITADGGFDFSNDFKNQENSVVPLLFGQIAYALCMQKQNGCFVLKIFDCFMLPTIDLLYLLSSFYRNVYICKPQTSRYANSEKYIVCKHFLYSSCFDFYPYLYNCFREMMDSQNFCCDEKMKNISFRISEHSRKIGRFLNIPLTNIFITRLEEYNSILGQQQIENIHNTISLIESKYKNEKINQLLKTNIQKSIQWCIKHKIPYHLPS